MFSTAHTIVTLNKFKVFQIWTNVYSLAVAIIIPTLQKISLYNVCKHKPVL